jgi:uncharacterized membrane protein YecN with MAPEG domain
MILPITLTIAGAAALLNIWLARRVGQIRMSNKISIGDGGNEALTARMRAQANFVEYTPFFLILLALIELAIGSRTWLWIVAVVYILGRIAHAFGMDRPHPDRLRLRMIGSSSPSSSCSAWRSTRSRFPIWNERRRGSPMRRKRPSQFLPGICRRGGPGEAWWRGSFQRRRTPPPRFARSPSPGNPGEECG